MDNAIPVSRKEEPSQAKAAEKRQNRASTGHSKRNRGILGNLFGFYFYTGNKKEKKDSNMSGSFQGVTGYQLVQKWQRLAKPGCRRHKRYTGKDFPDRCGLAKTLRQFDKGPGNYQQCE